MNIILINEAGAQTIGPEVVGHALDVGVGLVWIDFGHDDDGGLRLLTDLLDARPADVEDCHTRLPVPKLHAYSDHYFSAINGLARGTDERLYFQPLKIFFNANMLVTVMGPTSAALTPDAVRRDITRIRDRVTARELVPASAFELVSEIRFQMLRTHEALVADVAAQAAELESASVCQVAAC